MRIRRKIMQEEDFKHVWVVPSNKMWVKAFLWFYDASPKDLTFCRLWWGFIFMLPLLPFRLCVAAGQGVSALIPASESQYVPEVQKRSGPKVRFSAPRRVRMGKSITLKLPSKVYLSYTGRNAGFPVWSLNGERLGSHELLVNYQPTEPGWYTIAMEFAGQTIERRVQVLPPSTMMRVLDKIEDLFGRLSTWAGQHETLSSALILTPLVLVLGGLLTMLGITLGPTLVHALSTVPHLASGAFVAIIALQWVVPAGIILGGVLGGLAVSLGVIWLVTEGKVMQAIANFLGRGVKQGGMGLGRAMLISYKSVKSNTCPRVEIR